MNAVQQIHREYIDSKPWMRLNKPSLQVKCFERRLSKSSSILDIGCGAGMDTKYLRECRHSVISIDTDSPCADIICDVVDMPFSDKHFDGVFCRGMLHLCSNIDQAFEEILRVSKYEAIIFISYSLDIMDNVGKIQLGKLLSYDGRAIKLYERISKKNHQNHYHNFYSGVLKNVVH